MQLDELIAVIGSERDTSCSSSSNGFSWLSSSDKAPKHGDHKLAASIRSGSTVPSKDVVSDIIRLGLKESAMAAIGSFSLSESDSISLLSHFDDLLGIFLSTGQYSPEKLRRCLRSDASDDDVLRLLEKCTLFLEESMASMEDSHEELERYIDFLSLVIDARFMSWLVKGDGVEVGSRITRLTAVVSRYRRLLFTRQQEEIKGEKSEIFSFLQKKVTPKYDGRLFYHHLA